MAHASCLFVSHTSEATGRRRMCRCPGTYGWHIHPSLGAQWNSTSRPRITTSVAGGCVARTARVRDLSRASACRYWRGPLHSCAISDRPQTQFCIGAILAPKLSQWFIQLAKLDFGIHNISLVVRALTQARISRRAGIHEKKAPRSSLPTLSRPAGLLNKWSKLRSFYVYNLYCHWNVC